VALAVERGGRLLNQPPRVRAMAPVVERRQRGVLPFRPPLSSLIFWLLPLVPFRSQEPWMDSACLVPIVFGDAIWASALAREIPDPRLEHDLAFVARGMKFLSTTCRTLYQRLHSTRLLWPRASHISIAGVLRNPYSCLL
jgi:hypothetical protein